MKSLVVSIAFGALVITTSTRADVISDFYNNTVNHNISFSDQQTIWSSFREDQQQAAIKYDHEHGTNYFSDYKPGFVSPDADGVHNQAITLTEATQPTVDNSSHLDATQHYTSEPGAHLDGSHLTSEPQAHLDGTHYISEPQAHLDGQHSQPEHITATAKPSVDNSSHLDATQHFTSEPGAHLDGSHLTSEPQAHLDGTHYISEPQAHLDGQHSQPEHITATAKPSVDNSSHLDATQHFTSEPGAHLDGSHLTSEPQAHLDGTHYISEPQTHLDGQHSQPEHITATAKPSIDQSIHLDSNATDADRQNAKDQAMIDYLQSHVKNGVDGKNGNDGVTTTITKLDTATQAKVISNSRAIQDNSQAISKMNNSFASLKDEVNDNHKEANAGISGAMAQANIPQVMNNQRVAIGAGVGGYDGENAVAVGASARLGDSVVIKATVSDDTANNIGYGAGASIGW